MKEYTAEINDQLPMIETLNDEHKGLLRNRSASFLTVPPLEMHSARIQVEKTVLQDVCIFLSFQPFQNFIKESIKFLFIAEKYPF